MFSWRIMLMMMLCFFLQCNFLHPLTQHK
jgi:hypothetical protein